MNDKLNDMEAAREEVASSTAEAIATLCRRPPCDLQECIDYEITCASCEKYAMDHRMEVVNLVTCCFLMGITESDIGAYLIFHEELDEDDMKLAALVLSKNFEILTEAMENGDFEVTETECPCCSDQEDIWNSEEPENKEDSE